MKKIYFVPVFFLLGLVGCNNYKKPNENVYNNIPSLEELSAEWVSTDTVVMEPSIRNFRGQALLNRDLTSISWFVSAPFSGGYHTGIMKLNGETPIATLFRWQPYQALRKGKVDNFEVLSSTRMLFDENAVMWKVEITNNDSKPRELNIDLDMIGFISKYNGDWQWWYPYPKMTGKTTIRDEEVENVRKYIGKDQTEKEAMVYELIDGKPTPKKTIVKWPTDDEILNCTRYKTNTEENAIYIHDKETTAITAFSLVTQPDNLIAKNSGGTANWNMNVEPGKTVILKYIMSYGDEINLIKSNLAAWTRDFDTQFESVKTNWEEKWLQIFKPGNSLISGCFPVLETNDSLARKVYYTSPLTMLYLINTNLPEHKKVFLTGGPRWGASITFFWDITLWSTLWAVVDPVMMKEHTLAWIKINPSKYYGKDNFGGKGVGNGYSANYWALYQIIHSYITVTKDYEFLKEKVEDLTILQHLEKYSMNWKKISIYGQKGCEDDIYRLADFGDDEWNLLECVPTYKHIVPSFNIGYTWMMRETAKFYEKLGNKDKADSLNIEADEMLQRILKLYAGNGVWNSLYPNNKKIEIRHCLDFTFFGKYIPNDIPQNIKDEMIDFLYRELLTDNWMRAQSLNDIAAGQSDRCDHGPLGAFDGWPAEVMDALSRMGYTQKALDFYHNIEPVTHEGIWAQAHELWGENKETKKAQVRIPERDWCNRESTSGVVFSQVMLKNFFGFYPGIENNQLSNSNLDFHGKLYHVLYGGKYYTIENVNGQNRMIEEK